MMTREDALTISSQVREALAGFILKLRAVDNEQADFDSENQKKLRVALFYEYQLNQHPDADSQLAICHHFISNPLCKDALSDDVREELTFTPPDETVLQKELDKSNTTVILKAKDILNFSKESVKEIIPVLKDKDGHIQFNDEADLYKDADSFHIKQEKLAEHALSTSDFAKNAASIHQKLKDTFSVDNLKIYELESYYKQAMLNLTQAFVHRLYLLGYGVSNREKAKRKYEILYDDSQNWHIHAEVEFEKIRSHDVDINYSFPISISIDYALSDEDHENENKQEIELLSNKKFYARNIILQSKNQLVLKFVKFCFESELSTDGQLDLSSHEQIEFDTLMQAAQLPHYVNLISESSLFVQGYYLSNVEASFRIDTRGASFYKDIIRDLKIADVDGVYIKLELTESQRNKLSSESEDDSLLSHISDQITERYPQMSKETLDQAINAHTQNLSYTASAPLNYLLSKFGYIIRRNRTDFSSNVLRYINNEWVVEYAIAYSSLSDLSGSVTVPFPVIITATACLKPGAKRFELQGFEIVSCNARLQSFVADVYRAEGIKDNDDAEVRISESDIVTFRNTFKNIFPELEVPELSLPNPVVKSAPLLLVSTSVPATLGSMSKSSLALTQTQTQTQTPLPISESLPISTSLPAAPTTPAITSNTHIVRKKISVHQFLKENYIYHMLAAGLVFAVIGALSVFTFGGAAGVGVTALALYAALAATGGFVLGSGLFVIPPFRDFYEKNKWPILVATLGIPLLFVCPFVLPAVFGAFALPPAIAALTIIVAAATTFFTSITFGATFYRFIKSFYGIADPALKKNTPLRREGAPENGNSTLNIRQSLESQPAATPSASSVSDTGPKKDQPIPGRFNSSMFPVSRDLPNRYCDSGLSEDSRESIKYKLRKNDET